MPHAIRPGDVLADRYHLVDLLDESAGGLFWRAYDSMLDRSVALHLIRADDPRAELLRDAARTSAQVVDRRMLRVLDVDETTEQTAGDGGALCYVVNEWASGVSLDILLADEGPLAPRRAAWLVSEVASTLDIAHTAGRRPRQAGPRERADRPHRLGPGDRLRGRRRPARAAVGPDLHRRRRPRRPALRRPDRHLARRRPLGRADRAAHPRPGAASPPGASRGAAGARRPLRRRPQPVRRRARLPRPRQRRRDHRGRHRRRVA